MRRAPIHAHVAGVQDALFAAVERELEDAFDDDAVVEREGAVEGGFDAGGEIDEAGDGAVGDVDAGLFGAGRGGEG